MGYLRILEENRDQILRIAAQHGASDVRVFGSVVRGEDNESSDVDFLVKLAPDRSLLDHAALIMEMEELLGRPVDVVTETGLKERIRKRILSEAISL